MPCVVCRDFPVRNSQFEFFDSSLERHGVVFRCRVCGAFLEILAEERSVRFPPIEELKKYYPKLK